MTRDQRRLKRCGPQQKVRFPSVGAAEGEMFYRQSLHGAAAPQRAYECPHCGGWHLTSMERPPWELQETKGETEMDTNETAVTIEEITPAYAALLLEKNTHNRKVRESTVDLYASQMRSGDWKPNSQIQIAADGTLIDGQHRLLACVRSSSPFRCVVVRNAELDWQAVTDIGERRSFADYLRLSHGVVNESKVAATVLSTFLFEAGGGQVSLHGNFQDPVTKARRAPTHFELRDWFLKYQDAHVETARLTNRLQARPVLLPVSATCIPVFAAFASGMSEEAEQFVDEVRMGGPQLAGTTALRERGMRWAASTGTRPGRPVVKATVITAWNRWVGGEEVKTLRAVPRGRFAVQDEAGQAIFPFTQPLEGDDG